MNNTFFMIFAKQNGVAPIGQLVVAFDLIRCVVRDINRRHNSIFSQDLANSGLNVSGSVTYIYRHSAESSSVELPVISDKTYDYSDVVLAITSFP
jgi:hypothetical protein